MWTRTIHYQPLKVDLLFIAMIHFLLSFPQDLCHSHLFWQARSEHSEMMNAKLFILYIIFHIILHAHYYRRIPPYFIKIIYLLYCEYMKDEYK